MHYAYIKSKPAHEHKRLAFFMRTLNKTFPKVPFLLFLGAPLNIAD